MYTWVCGILGLKFCLKIAPRSSRLVLDVRSHGPTGLKIGSLWIDFPVWRELKLSGHQILFWQSIHVLWIDFPVWRELKHSRNTGTHPIVFSLDRLSRLKGIETLNRARRVLYRDPSLWIDFPVWRELKRHSRHESTSPLGLWIDFPVWRELKHLNIT